MRIEKDVCLAKYTTIRIGGTANNLYCVESEDDIINLIKGLNQHIYILGKGSNLLINDNKEFKHVLNMNTLLPKLKQDGDITVVSASVSLQKLINYVNQQNKGGIEYLYSVPASVGGAICMNAGRGRSFNKNISDYLVDVKIFDGERVRVVDKESCEFSYRNSIFKSKKWIILSARFKFETIDIEETAKLKKERVELSRQVQHANKPNLGSVFRISNRRIMTVFKKFKVGWNTGVQFSSKTNNWLINNGKGSFKQAMILINLVKFIHKCLLRKCSVEYIIWK